MIKNSKLYDLLKELCQVVLPALGTLYFALSGIWGFPYGEQIVGTITAVVTFLGVCLHISNANYTNEYGEILGEAQHKISELQDDYVGEVFEEEGDDEDE